MFEKLSNNLNLLMANARLNASELARQINLPASTIKKIRNNDNPNPTLTTLIPLAEYFSITVSQLIGDEQLSLAKTKKNSVENCKLIYSVPLISWPDAVSWPRLENTPKSFVETKHIYSEHTFALIIEEDDLGALTKDSVLFIDPTCTAAHKDFVIVHKKGRDIPTLRQVFYDDDHTYLKPLASGYSMTILTPEHQFLGVVMEYQKKFKN